MCTRGAHHSARLGRDSLAVFQKDRVSAGRWHAPGSVNLNRVLRGGWANHVSQESCSCRTPRNATPVCPCEGYLLAGGGHSPAQAYGISWLIRKRPPETRIAVDYILCRAAHVCSFLFFPNQRTRQGRAEYGAVLLLDSTRRSDTIPHGKGALQPGTTGLCRNAGGPRIVSREPTYVQH